MTAEVLLVDDDCAALYALSEVLSDLPVRLTLVTSGEDALRQVLKREFSAILLDVRLPRMDGFEVAAAIRSLERSRQTPVIFMSAHDDRRKQARPGAEDYLRKPLAPALVRSKVAALIQPHDLQYPARGQSLQPTQDQL